MSSCEPHSSHVSARSRSSSSVLRLHTRFGWSLRTASLFHLSDIPPHCATSGDFPARWISTRRTFRGPCAPNGKGVIGCFRSALDANAVFVNDFLVRLRPTLLVIYIPTQQPKKGIDEFLPQLSLVVVRTRVGFQVLVEALDQYLQPLGNAIHRFIKALR